MSRQYSAASTSPPRPPNEGAMLTRELGWRVDVIRKAMLLCECPNNRGDVLQLVVRDHGKQMVLNVQVDAAAEQAP